MTKICYDGVHWTSDHVLFKYAGMRRGPLATWHGQTFGGTCAYAFLGPDLKMPGGASHNPPKATGPGWDQAWTHAAAGGPPCQFTTDPNGITWVRGHLVNGEWGGPGDYWENLTPLTSQGNANHKTIENLLKTYLENFKNFDQSNAGHRAYWYCLQYWVQVSNVPWAAAPATMNDLYSYAPNMIKATWRIKRLAKPVGAAGTTASAHFVASVTHVDQPPAGTLTPATGAQIAADLPHMPAGAAPAFLTATPANAVEFAATAAAVAAGGVPPYHAIPAGWPGIPAAANPFDGECVIYQT